MAKVVPDETAYTEEAPPPGYKDDGTLPELDESANDEFLEASRKARAEALARRGARRYNKAIRIVGAVAIFNMFVCCVPLIDGSYELTWVKVSGAFVNYGLTHKTLIDSRGGGGDNSFAPYEHFRIQYEHFDTSYGAGIDRVASYVLELPGLVPASREKYCPIVAHTLRLISANNQSAPMDPWCEAGVDASFALSVSNLVCAWVCVALWWLLLHGDGDVPPYRTFKYAPPDAEHPDGKAWVLTPYHLIAAELLQGCLGVSAFEVWDRRLTQRYHASNCATQVCAVPNTLYHVAIGCALLPFLIAVFYRGIALQDYVYTLKKLHAAVKRGDTFGVLKIAGETWFLRYIDDPDPSGSGRTALHWAARRGYTTMAAILVQSGADPRVKDSSGWNSMHHASRYGHREIVKNLLGSPHGGELCNQRDAAGNTPLHLCAASGGVETAMTLMHSSGKPDLDAGNGLGQTPLMLALATGEGNAILDILVTAGADLRRRDKDGSTAFHYAASANSVYAVERLLRGTYRASLAPRGGRPRPAVTLQAQHNRYGDSAADEARSRGPSHDTVRRLLEANAKLFTIDDAERLASGPDTDDVAADAPPRVRAAALQRRRRRERWKRRGEEQGGEEAKEGDGDFDEEGEDEDEDEDGEDKDDGEIDAFGSAAEYTSNYDSQEGRFDDRGGGGGDGDDVERRDGGIDGDGEDEEDEDEWPSDEERVYAHVYEVLEEYDDGDEEMNNDIETGRRDDNERRRRRPPPIRKEPPWAFGLILRQRVTVGGKSLVSWS